tara:strand:- start:37426 stop:37845 length:420 start_codon:yes stop_codon:yes gene_type:complete
MKQFIHKSIAICMAFAVLMTTMSFTVDMHFCGDTMVDFAFFKSADSCGMEKAAVATNCENPTVSKKSCCTDKQLVIEGQDDLKDTLNSFTFEQHTFVAAFTYSYISLFTETASTAISFVDYPPPFVKRDVQVLHQTFLI